MARQHARGVLSVPADLSHPTLFEQELPPDVAERLRIFHHPGLPRHLTEALCCEPVKYLRFLATKVLPLLDMETLGNTQMMTSYNSLPWTVEFYRIPLPRPDAKED